MNTKSAVTSRGEASQVKHNPRTCPSLNDQEILYSKSFRALMNKLFDSHALLREQEPAVISVHKPATDGWIFSLQCPESIEWTIAGGILIEFYKSRDRVEPELSAPANQWH